MVPSITCTDGCTQVQFSFRGVLTAVCIYTKLSRIEITPLRRSWMATVCSSYNVPHSISGLAIAQLGHSCQAGHSYQ